MMKYFVTGATGFVGSHVARQLVEKGHQVVVSVRTPSKARELGVVEKFLPVPADYSAEYLRVSAGVTYIGNNTKALRELGYSPHPLEIGLTETLQHEMKLLGM